MLNENGNVIPHILRMPCWSLETRTDIAAADQTKQAEAVQNFGETNEKHSTTSIFLLSGFARSDSEELGKVFSLFQFLIFHF